MLNLKEAFQINLSVLFGCICDVVLTFFMAFAVLSMGHFLQTIMQFSAYKLSTNKNLLKGGLISKTLNQSQTLHQFRIIDPGGAYAKALSFARSTTPLVRFTQMAVNQLLSEFYTFVLEQLHIFL